jgi:hypothetical protein
LALAKVKFKVKQLESPLPKETKASFGLKNSGERMEDLYIFSYRIEHCSWLFGTKDWTDHRKTERKFPMLPT